MGLKAVRALGFTLIMLISACAFPGLAPAPKVEVTPTTLLNPSPTPTIDFSEPTSQPVIESKTISQITLTGLKASTVLRGVFGNSLEINPLTGLVVTDPSMLERRPILTKISNYPASGRPHAGLSLADVVFEYYIGENTNRFLAIFYSQNTPKSWPLRSGRLIDAQLTNMYGGILIYGNADPRVETIITRDLYKRAMPFVLSNCPPICGEETHSATGVWVDTTTFTDWAVKQGLDNERPDLTGMVFDSNPPPGGIPVNTLDVKYIIWNHGQWRYDPASGQYLRYIEAWDGTNKFPLIPLIDEVNKKQVSYTNVVILFAEYEEFSPTYHDVHIWPNTTGQRALYFRDGFMYEGSWLTSDPYHPIRLLDANNQPMPLKPGTTWYVIAGLNSDFSQIASEQYILNFDLP